MTTPKASVLIFGDPGSAGDAIVEAFDAQRWKCHRVRRSDPSAALSTSIAPDVIVVLGETMEELVESVRRLARSSFAPVIAVVPDGDVTQAVAVVRAGAETALERRNAAKEVIAWANQCLEIEASSSFDGDVDPRDIFVRHPRSPLHELLASFPQMSRSDYPILIMGESGTGKELAAKVLHAMSERREGPFIAVNCGAIPESLLESELFGHCRGAFTGADADRVGHFQAAQGGTIFLDEIATLPLNLQVTLLRVLEERTVRPVGSSADVPVDFRVIAATNLSLEEAVAAGEFREDLFYRLNVFPIILPPLRQRTMDIPVLADYFIDEQNARQGTSIDKLSPQMRTILKQYPWPGNIRELKNLIQRVCVLKQVGGIEEDDLPPPIMEDDFVDHLGLDVPSEGIDMTSTLDRLEDHLLVKALSKAAGNKAKAARLLGLNRTTLVEKLKRKRLDTPINK